jgi:two-component system sensor histidine kinase/response regulator
MNKPSINILYIEDDEDHAILFMEMLSSIDQFPHSVTHVESLTAGINALSGDDFNVAILDLGLSESHGLDTLRKFIEHCPHIPVIVLTTNADLQLSVDAIKTGAQDFLIKGEFAPNMIARSVRYAIERFDILNELAQKNESLNTFAAAASHDLKTPLRNIMMIIDLFRSDYADNISTSGNMELLKIQTAVKRLYSLIDSLMEFTKSETKLSAPALFPMNICIEGAIALLASDIKETQAQISVEDNLPQVFGDHGLLLRVFQNLIGNAIKYVEGKPPQIRIGMKEQPEYPNEFIFYVADNGIGIKEQYFERIFEPLKRLHTQQEYPGSGIGLAVCKRIIIAHGGQIWVESNPEVGSTFYFTLPKTE